jgi:aminopeptidase N
VIRELLMALLLGATATPPPDDPAAGEAGAGFDVVSYQVALIPDVAGKTVAGRETILLRPTQDGIRRLRFSANALAIEAATLDGVAIAPTPRGATIDFDLPEPLARGRTLRLELAYHGRPARGFAGTETLLYTSYFACDWMLCAQDAFGDKAEFALDLRVPAGMDTLAAGNRIALVPGPDGSSIHRWKAPRPYPAYLFGFAVGRFARAGDTIGSSRLTYLSDAATPAELRRRFADTPAMAAFFAEKAGMPLPVADYAQLLVAGDEAQEAATYAVLGTDAVPAAPGDPDEDWAIAHELAHQWWGNLVTCATLRDFWLNEGITTFLTAAWKEHRFGATAYAAEFALARDRLGKARARGFDKPLAWLGRYPDLRTRRAIQYSKGALFMAELRTTLGERAFWGGLRRYTRRHAGGTATSIDLQRAMEASSGRDLRALFATWVFGDGDG